MNLEKLVLEIELLRTEKEVACKALEAMAKFASVLKEINDRSESIQEKQNSSWIEMKNRTYNKLVEAELIQRDYEENKSRLIQLFGSIDKKIEISSEMRVAFDSKANVVKVYIKERKVEIL